MGEAVRGRELPRVTRTYANHHLDSARWQRYRPRAGDVVVATSLKSGTTWMQAIVLNLLFGPEAAPSPAEASPWLDFRLRPFEEMLARLEAQTHRRVLKSHLPLDGLPFHPEVRYVVVARDARDVFMSLYNHYANYTPEMYRALGENWDGAPLPPCPDDPRTFWRSWITRGWFPWESEGYPFWGNLHHTATWWRFRHLPNVLLVHYADLQRDLEGEIGRVAARLELSPSEATIAAVAEAVSFDAMKRRAAEIAPWANGRLAGGPDAFIYKGTNGRWRGVLEAEDLELHDAALARVLPEACAAWLQQGRGGMPGPGEL